MVKHKCTHKLVETTHIDSVCCRIVQFDSLIYPTSRLSRYLFNHHLFTYLFNSSCAAAYARGLFYSTYLAIY